MSQLFYPPRRRLTQKFYCYGGVGATPAAGATRYYFLRGGLSSMQTLDAYAQTVFRQRGTLRNLRVRALPGVAAAPVVLRINGVSQAMTVTIPAGGLEQELTDLVNEVLVVPGDLVNWMITTGVAGSPTMWRVEVDFVPEV